jgi:hypothetical protein
VRLASLVFTASVVLLSFLIGDNSIAGVAEEQVCDVAADYSLGVEDYSEAIRRHVQVLNEHPADAELETLASTQLNPDQPDARNLLGVTSLASLTWRGLIRDIPDYEPARTNLAVLGSPSKVATGETAAVNLPRAAAVDAIMDER